VAGHRQDGRSARCLTTTPIALYRQLRIQSTSILTNDLWIAAIVVEHDLALYSRDAHFDVLPQLSLI
jgi:predicted nucleic acid-binding protein